MNTPQVRLRCIAYVPNSGRTQAHRCKWRAHALPRTGVQVCEVHAGGRRGLKRHKRAHSQIDLFEEGERVAARIEACVGALGPEAVAEVERVKAMVEGG